MGKSDRARPGKPKRFADLIGRQFGRLTVIRGRKIKENDQSQIRRCACGREAEARQDPKLLGQKES